MSPRKNKKKNSLSNKKKSRITKNSSNNSELDNVKENNNRFGDILNKKWKIFRVSPIYNFSGNKLKFYEKKLNEELNSKSTVISDAGYKSKLTLNKNLRLSGDSAEALQIEIMKNESIRSYVGHFMSWSNSTPDDKYSVSLPLLLVEAKAYEATKVHSSLCKIFDCDIQPVTFSFSALITFLVKLLETPRKHIDVTQEIVTLEYKVPECGINDKIKISLVLEATTIVYAVVMDSLQEKCQEITTTEIVFQFYDKLLSHMYQVYKMNLIAAELQKITFPDAFLTNDGQIKMSTDDAVISSLEVLGHFVPIDGVINILKKQ